MKSRALLFAAAGIAVLAGLFVLFRPSTGPDAPPASPASPAPTVPAIPANVVELVVRDGKLVSGPAAIRVDQGDEITLRVTADLAEEFHLHGYDRKLALEPGVPAELKLLADRSGRFEYELEKSRLELGVLEVLPP
jgi:hypothetical protein